MKKAILIDAVNQTIEETTIDTWQDIAPAIGCEWFTIVHVDVKNDLYVDDEGLLHNPQNFILLDGYPQPLAGSGLILGSTPDGNSCDTSLTVEQVQAKVKFLDLDQVRKMV